jgi:hypothetical protein
MEIYKRLLLKATPLDLHEAYLEGKLFEFAQRFHNMDEEHRRLMKNFYPLKMVEGGFSKRVAFPTAGFYFEYERVRKESHTNLIVSCVTIPQEYPPKIYIILFVPVFFFSFWTGADTVFA